MGIRKAEPLDDSLIFGLAGCLRYAALALARADSEAEARRLAPAFAARMEGAVKHAGPVSDRADQNPAAMGLAEGQGKLRTAAQGLAPIYAYLVECFLRLSFPCKRLRPHAVVVVGIAQRPEFFPEHAERALIFGQAIPETPIMTDGFYRAEKAGGLAAHVAVVEPLALPAAAQRNPGDRPLVHETERGRPVPAIEQIVDNLRLTLQFALGQSDSFFPAFFPVLARGRVVQRETRKSPVDLLDQLLCERQAMVLCEGSLQRPGFPSNGVRLPPQLDGQARKIRFRQARQILRQAVLRPAAK